MRNVPVMLLDDANDLLINPSALADGLVALINPRRGQIAVYFYQGPFFADADPQLVVQCRLQLLVHSADLGECIAPHKGCWLTDKAFPGEGLVIEGSCWVRPQMRAILSHIVGIAVNRARTRIRHHLGDGRSHSAR